ncbi:helix-turn-helix domain-containing protein [Elizabethkingia meningoseptica]|uniref:helix-turn-helix domain-containing protein n=1 Tax=Elizabethkingia meningoseptica TaxID=238 RepID=UPI0022F1D5F3|nr:helix-turn-helix domain-containing protein [Elizabethkingia meningoseptica]EJK5328084.1 helix-turn-helix transcriptional regulator [Elizabethkingia meningoseptica]WBS74153.1 helix-turn-helix domain-containing protein [Elizabethkingia meningoseptica]
MKIFNKFLLLLLFFTFCNFQSQNVKKYTYSELNKLFDDYPENDSRAMIFVNLYIEKAKKEKELSKLIAGYDEAVYYDRSVERKIKYADSAVVVALETNDRDRISMAYLKRGIIYYYNERNYNKALQEYLAAFKYSKNTEDHYLYHKILYHLGIVKCYLGFYQEAALHFNETASYYEKEASRKLHPNLRLNNEHGYLNSIYRLSSCYRNLKLYKKEDSLIQIGFERIQNSKQFALELAYFQKAKGIQNIRKKQSSLAYKYLKSSERILKNEDDFVSLATVYFSLGKLNFTNGDQKSALLYFSRVDSILNKFNFVSPEVVNNYKYLIQYAKEKGDDRLQLYYTNKLLRADSIISSDFSTLSTRIYREYQVDRLNESRNNLIRKHNWESSFLSLIIVCVLLIFFYFLFRYRQRQKILTKKYCNLLEKIKNKDLADNEPIVFNENAIKSIYSDETIDEIRKNLQVFEDKKQFLDKDLKLPDVARLIKSHRSALSFVLNEHMNTSFTQYIKVLRINYITKKMMEDKIYLKYSMDTLASECGMKNRNVFSNHFLEINGIRPTDFVKKRLQERENN